MVATTEKVSLSLDTGALILARRAAEIEGLSLSAYMSGLVKKYVWASQRPILTADEQALTDERIAALDEQELWNDEEGHRATG
jgi:hypothetical protein